MAAKSWSAEGGCLVTEGDVVAKVWVVESGVERGAELEITLCTFLREVGSEGEVRPWQRADAFTWRLYLASPSACFS